MTAATLQMNPPQLNPPKWISPKEYNSLPSVEEAREQIPVEDQIEITKKLSEYLLTTEKTKGLAGKIGTFILHSHHKTKENEVISGELEDGTLTSKPTSLEEGKIPINWIVRGKGLTPMEGINVSLETIEKVGEVSTMVQKNEEFLASFLKNKADENSLGVSVDPRLYLPNSEYYLETNDENSSIVTPLENPKEYKGKTITTYVSTSLNPRKVVCYRGCAALSNGVHVPVHGTPVNPDNSTNLNPTTMKCYQVCIRLKEEGVHVKGHGTPV